MLVQQIRFHDYEFEISDSKGLKWRWTTRLDVSLSTPSYWIHNILTPYGRLRDTISVPGDVVTAMSASIAELQANFTPKILMGPPSSLTFVVDEGFGVSSPQGVQVTNNGVYGSILGVTLTPAQVYVATTPGLVGDLALNQTGTFNVTVDSTDLLASMSPISTTIGVVDPTATNNPISYPVSITIRPKATISTSVSSVNFSVTKPISGPFPDVPTQSFDVSNTGPSGSVLGYSIQKLIGISDWLISFLPSSGSLNSGVSSTVVVTVAPPQWMSPGTYTETLRVSGYSTNTYLDVQIQLVIS